jgi:hypothetical protein
MRQHRGELSDSDRRRYGEADAALSDTERRDDEAPNALMPQGEGPLSTAAAAAENFIAASHAKATLRA